MQNRQQVRTPFFSFSLHDMLKDTKTDTPDDYLSVVNFHINQQLQILGNVDTKECRQLVGSYYQVGNENFRILEEAVNEDKTNQYPLLFSCYALAIDDINKLDRSKLAHAITWLDNKSNHNPTLDLAYNNLLAIQQALAYKEGSRIELADNFYVNLSKANLPKICLQNTDLSGINLSGANFADADLSGCTFKGAILKDANFDNANMSYANLQHTVLDGSFKNVDLTNADLRHAYMHKGSLNISGAKLFGATLDDMTVFFGATGKLTEAEFEKYYFEKKLMMMSIEFIHINELTDLTVASKTFTDLHEKLKDNMQLAFIQKCISHDFIRKVAPLKESNPALAKQLYNLAYHHPLFAHDLQVLQVVNSVSRSVYSLFSDSVESTAEMIESEPQEQMRKMFG